MKTMLSSSCVFVLSFCFGWPAGSADASEYRIPDATLMFLQNSNKLVERWSDAQISHVGMIFNHNGSPFVYEATPDKVRRVALDDYYKEIGRLNYGRSRKIRVWLREPLKPYTDSAVKNMKRFLDNQVGRRYSIKGIVRGKKGDGIHCSELASKTLNRGKRLELTATQTITPANLYKSVDGQYDLRLRIAIHDEKPPGSWGRRTWSCITDSANWCKWCCRDTWSWLW